MERVMARDTDISSTVGMAKQHVRSGTPETAFAAATLLVLLDIRRYLDRIDSDTSEIVTALARK